MVRVAHAFSMGMLILAASPAAAADWWLVSGVPGNPTAVFADVDTLAREGQLTRLRVVRIDRAGSSAETLQQIQCDRPAASPDEELVRQFACASEKDRDHYGLILPDGNPGPVAQMIFSMDAKATAQGDAEPRT